MTACQEAKRHLDPVHFNRGRHGHVWICINCERQLSGPKLEQVERLSLIIIAIENRKGFEERKAKRVETKGKT